MKRLFYLLTAALVFVFSIDYAQTINRQQIDSLFSDWTVASQPGGVVAIMKGDDVVYKNAFGLADIRSHLPNSFELKYDLASLAKQFTGACIALLAEKGALSYSDGLKKYYPQFRMADSIKIKNLLDHTSGLREAYVLATLAGKVNLKGEVRRKFNTKENLIKVLSRETDLNFTPGTELAYTNINYILLADIVEKISGQPFNEFADSALFQKAGMHNTKFRYKEKITIPGEAKGYLYHKKVFKEQEATGGILGDGKLVTTIDDLILWERYLRHHPELTLRLYTSSRFNDGKLTHYGMGFWTDEYRGLTQINHGGDDGRFTSFIMKFPSQNITIMVLANSSRYTNTIGKVYSIADVIFKSTFQKPRFINKTFDYVKPTHTDLTHRDAMYFRIDEHGLASIRNLAVIHDTLHVFSWYYDKGTAITKISTGDWVMRTKTGATLQYHFQDSTWQSFQEQFEDHVPFHFERTAPELSSPGALTGCYTNQSTGVTIKIIMKKGHLQARKGIIRIPLISLGNDQYFAIQHDALFIFDRHEKASKTTLKINASDFRNFNLTRR